MLEVVLLQDSVVHRILHIKDARFWGMHRDTSWGIILRNSLANELNLA